MTSKGSRIGVAIAIVALTLPIVALGVVFTGLVSTPIPASESASGSETDPGAPIDNPLQGQTFYVDPESLAAKAAAASAAADQGGSDWAVAPSAQTEVLDKLAATPAAIWLVPEKYPTETVAATVTATLDAAAASGQTPVFVVYGVPNRDCGNLSSGGLTAAEYPLWAAADRRGLRRPLGHRHPRARRARPRDPVRQRRRAHRPDQGRRRRLLVDAGRRVPRRRALDLASGDARWPTC